MLYIIWCKNGLLTLRTTQSLYNSFTSLQKQTAITTFVQQTDANHHTRSAQEGPNYSNQNSPQILLRGRLKTGVFDVLMTSGRDYRYSRDWVLWRDQRRALCVCASAWELHACLRKSARAAAAGGDGRVGRWRWRGRESLMMIEDGRVVVKMSRKVESDLRISIDSITCTLEIGQTKFLT